MQDWTGLSGNPCPQMMSCSRTPTIIVTPHIGGGTADLGDIILPMLTEDITAFAAGKEPGHIVNRQFLTTAG